ncbi:putative RNA recognition motif (a k a RRM RBD or RNP domain) [Trypanosoma vivax]|uniref:Putative RNA-binding protein (Drbd14) n=1 Tax=Trypanosoma vivax (strain Y486) TaxID=1055687 RepID=G0U9W5_TRYVY|nr:hypothetical protein TRVL_02114 [Trypanosoma vivax]KAH8619065.1 putative RNA recognition motif (a k a RRM RBD or RNP domain) [Trypanosoma vivax]CCC52596.1 DRBD14 [Trypanosoma vivax Y486]
MLDTPLLLEQPLSPVSSTSTAEVTAGHDISTVNRTLDVSFVFDEGTLDFDSKHWIRVSLLDQNTTSRTLRSMFYPYCGDEAFVLWDNGVVGYVGFENRAMANLAVEKMDAFIPCGQAQALRVTHVPTEKVMAAKSNAFSQKSFFSLLHSDCPATCIAQMIESHRQPCYCAIELVEEVKQMPQSLLPRVSEALSKLKRCTFPLEQFCEALVKHLLRQIVEEDSVDSKANCGTLLGELFKIGLLPGDPFKLASSIMQRGVSSVSQVDSICAIAHACTALPFPMSKAEFWAIVGQMSLDASEPLRSALRQNMRRFHHNTELLSPNQFAEPKKAPSVLKANKLVPSFTDMRLRTLYVSHLPPTLPQQTFFDFLKACGEVTKVRVCRGKMYATLFAFVEMASVEGALAALRLDRMNLHGCNIRVQMARNPIQDSQADDALIDSNGIAARRCLFGNSGSTLADAAVLSCEKSC